MAKRVLPELLGQSCQAWAEDPGRGGAQEGKDPARGHSAAGGRPGALTQVGVALAVVARHVGAAAPVALADATLVQRVGREEHPVTADGLQEGRRRGCWEGARRDPGAATAGGTGWAAGARGPVGACATVLNNLTFSRHADPSQVGELAGRAVAGGHHELPLAVHGGAVQVTRLAGDVHVVVCRETASQGAAEPESGMSPAPPHPDGDSPLSVVQMGTLRPGEWKGLCPGPQR